MRRRPFALLALTALLLAPACSDPPAESTPAACPPGTFGCPCANQACNAAPDGTALTCEDEVCVVPSANNGGNNVTGGGQVLDPEARSCELLFEEGEARVSGVTFDASVRGDFVRQAPRVALAFHADEDAPMTASVFELALEQGSVSDLNLASVRCFDAAGTELDGDLFQLTQN